MNAFYVKQSGGDTALIVLDNGMEVAVPRGTVFAINDPLSMNAINVIYMDANNVKVHVLGRDGTSRLIPQVTRGDFFYKHRPDLSHTDDPCHFERAVERATELMRQA
jgi:hypothetical protein